MTTRWIDTTSDEDSAFHSIDFWKGLNNNLDAGEFWADRIKRYRGDPAKRLNEAMNNLPLPAAFREAAIATRALITEKRKTGQDYDEELTLLYWLAAIRSFMIEYAPKLKQPGYNVMVSIPAKRIKSLPFSYKSLGYADLELLSKTDCKWIVEKWGNPDQHSTLNRLHKALWDEYENKLLEKRSKESDAFWSDLINGKLKGK